MQGAVKQSAWACYWIDMTSNQPNKKGKVTDLERQIILIMEGELGKDMEIEKLDWKDKRAERKGSITRKGVKGVNVIKRGGENERNKANE